MRVRFALSLVALLALAAPGVATARPAQPRIVGGGQASITAAPWQVGLVDGGGVFCGGSILDAAHVVTAAHCVTNDNGVPVSAASFDVLAGTEDAGAPNPPAAPAQRVAVQSITVHPSYDPATQTNDMAVLALVPELTLDGTTKAAVPVASATPPPCTNRCATITGWGATSDGGATSRYLMQAQVDVLADNDPTCAPATPYQFTDFEQSVFLCAAASGTDTCQGDSGGPLTASGILIGLTSFGEGCANPSYAGVYTELAAPSNRDFLTSVLPVPAPDSAPVLTGTPATGQRLTCDPGRWPGSPTLAYRYFANPSAPFVLRDFSADPTYVVADEDANRTIGCIVRATASSGATGTATSNTLGPVQGPSSPQPTTTTITVTTPAPVTDTTPPVSNVIARRCGRTSCRVDVEVTDPGYSTGVADISLTYVSRFRSTCAKGRRRVSCVLADKGVGVPVSLGRNVFATRLKGLHRNSSTVVTILATDKAGNRERFAVTAVLKTQRVKTAQR